MKRLIFISTFIFLLSFPAFVQTVSKAGAASLKNRLTPRLIDEFGRLPRNQVRARIDAFIAALDKEPNGKAYIINYGTDKEITAREKLIRDHFLRKYETNRITYVRGGANPTGETGAWTRIWIVPPDAVSPAEQ